MTLHFRLRSLAAVAALAALPAFAQNVVVSDARIGKTAKGQDSTMAYMNVTAPFETTLVSVSTSVARTAELALARNDDGTFKARPVEGIVLQPNRPLRMRPDGFQVTLKGLGRPLEDGERVPVTLVFRDKIGRMATVTAFANVQDVPPTAGPSAAY